MTSARTSVTLATLETRALEIFEPSAEKLANTATDKLAYTAADKLVKMKGLLRKSAIIVFHCLQTHILALLGVDMNLLYPLVDIVFHCLQTHILALSRHMNLLYPLVDIVFHGLQTHILALMGVDMNKTRSTSKRRRKTLYPLVDIVFHCLQTHLVDINLLFPLQHCLQTFGSFRTNMFLMSPRTPTMAPMR